MMMLAALSVAALAADAEHFMRMEVPHSVNQGHSDATGFKVHGLEARDADTQQSTNRKAECFQHRGKTVCAQTDTSNPTCPIQFIRAAHMSCVSTVHELNRKGEKNTQNTTITLFWWTDPTCMVHKTLCEIAHPVHSAQSEEELYDFSGACEESAHVQFHYHYNVEQGDRVVVMNRDATANFKLGEELLIFQLKNNSQPVFEQHTSVRLYERDSAGRVTYSTPNLDQSRLAPRTNDMSGLYAQIASKYDIYVLFEGEFVSVTDRYTANFRVTSYPVLPACSAEQRDTWQDIVVYKEKDDDSKAGVVIGVIAAIVVLVACVSFGIHYCIFQKKRHVEKTNEAVESNRVDVGQAPVVLGTAAGVANPYEMPPGVVVEGVLVQSGVPVQPVQGAQVMTECTAAPLPPQSCTVSADCQDTQQ